MLLLILFLFTDIEIPLVGRPEGFSGAVGEQVEIKLELSSKELRIGESVTLTLRITKLANAKSVKRPDLRQLPDFQNAFQIDDLTDPESKPDERIFVYQLRPRSVEVKQVPMFSFHFYNPRMKSQTNDEKKWFVRRDFDEIDLSVFPASKEPSAPIPLLIPDFAKELPTPDSLMFQSSSERVSSWWIGLSITLPFVGFAAWFWKWQQSHPSRLSRIRRSHAARLALAKLAKIDMHSIDPVMTIREIVSQYLDERDSPHDAAEFFALCDAARFSALPIAIDVRARAMQLIMQREETA